MKSAGLKLVSLLLAIVVWSVVSAPQRGQPIERALAASVSLVGMPQKFVIITPTTIPEKVTLRLRGRKADLDALTSRAVEGTVDLRWIQKPGEAAITLRPQAFNVPAEVEVVSIDPNKFRFRVEELTQRAVSIRPFLEGDVAGGHIVGTVSAAPDRALISGPATQIRAMQEVTTERIFMTARKETFTQTVAVVTDSPLVRVIMPLTTQVTVPIIAEIGPDLPPPTGTTDEGQPPTATGERSNGPQ